MSEKNLPAGVEIVHIPEAGDGVVFQRIPGYAKYAAGSDGSIWRLNVKNPNRKVNVGTRKDTGMAMASVTTSDGRHRTISVNALVYSAFHGCADGVVYNADGNPHNSRPDNLRVHKRELTRTDIPLPSMEDVEFRMIPGFPCYAAGSDGSIWSFWSDGSNLPVGPWRKLSLNPIWSGYLVVALSRHSRRVSISVHKLICLTFRGPKPRRDMECRHLNGIRTDNRSDNVAWGTKDENEADRRKHGRTIRGSRHKLAKLTEEDIPRILELRRQGWTHKMIAEEFNVSVPLISNIFGGRNWKHLTGIGR